MENLQPSGSFKSRYAPLHFSIVKSCTPGLSLQNDSKELTISSAMGNLILHHISNPAYANRKIHFYASSGGNAGLAAVCAARSLSYPCTVVLPVTTSPLMVQKIRAAGATNVIQYGETIAAAGEHMKNVVMMLSGGPESGGDTVKIALHPFDHEAIWQGNSTIIDELANQLPPKQDTEESVSGLQADAIICSVGGGGLMNGLVRGIERQNNQNESLIEVNSGTNRQRKKQNIDILAVETKGTASLALAMKKKSLVSLPKITSLAISLGCVRVAEETLKNSLSPPPGVVIHSVVMSDADAAKGVLRFADDERTLVELACGICIETAIGLVPKKCGTKRKRPLSDEGYHGAREEDGSTSESESFVDSAIGSEDELDVPQITRLKQFLPDLTPESRVVIIVCGGSNVTMEMASEWRKKIASGWKED
jgi:L-serine/L-threonine ammonia-lyase